MSPKIFAGIALLLAAAAPLRAGEIIYEPDGKKAVVEDYFPYTAGTLELEIGAGALGSLGTKGTDIRPHVGYAIGVLRLGVMLSTADGNGIFGDGLFRGNFEFVGEAFGGWIYTGPGDGLAGLDIYLRYNFVQPNAKIVPFFQIGGGGVYSDAAGDDAIQRNIGSDFCFVLEAQIGFRYHFNRNCALTGGIEYRHISNASTADRNQGLNSLGGLLGVSYFF